MKLAVLEDCHEDWDAMRARGSVRRCSSCARDVYDLTHLSTRTAVAYAALHGDTICARLPPTPLQRLGRALPRAPLLAATVATACASPTPRHDAAVERAVAPPSVQPAPNEPAATPAALPLAEPASTGSLTWDPGPAPEPPKRDVVVVVTMGVVVNVPRVTFERNATAIGGEPRKVLEEVARILMENPNIAKVIVAGSAATDERDPDALSKRRAEAVVAFLVERGVSAERLEVRADGATKPIADTRTRAGRDKSRRVSFEIVEPAASCPAP